MKFSTSALALAVAGLCVSAQAGADIGFDFNSAYVPSGLTCNDNWVFQPYMDVWDIKVGDLALPLEFGVWGNMDLDDYSQLELNADEIEDAIPFLTDGLEGIKALVQGEKVLCIQLPDSVELEIAETAPSMRGASVTARTKAATLETGLVVQVPEYIEQGEHIRVDTRTSQFIQRA